MIDERLEREIFAIKHGAFWKTLVERIDREVNSTLGHVLHSGDMNSATYKVAKLQGENRIKEIVQSFPETFLKLQEKAGEIEKDGIK